MSVNLQVKNDHIFILFLIVMKGLDDMARLAEMTMDSNWVNNDKKVEDTWCLLWTTRKRFEFFQIHCLDPNFLERYCKRLHGLESFFYDTFGVGLYLSPEIKIIHSVCSVCGNNIKGCMHLPGNVYDGVHCQERVIKMEVENISIVKTPFDLRCRVWPWNFEPDKRTFTAMFMSLEGIDSFLKPDIPVVVEDKEN